MSMNLTQEMLVLLDCLVDMTAHLLHSPKGYRSVTKISQVRNFWYYLRLPRTKRSHKHNDRKK
jgi:hypothetical protein